MNIKKIIEESQIRSVAIDSIIEQISNQVDSDFDVVHLSPDLYTIFQSSEDVIYVEQTGHLESKTVKNIFVKDSSLCDYDYQIIMPS
jgi:hypothetical protein